MYNSNLIIDHLIYLGWTLLDGKFNQAYNNVTRALKRNLKLMLHVSFRGSL